MILCRSAVHKNCRPVLRISEKGCCGKATHFLIFKTGFHIPKISSENAQKGCAESNTIAFGTSLFEAVIKSENALYNSFYSSAVCHAFYLRHDSAHKSAHIVHSAFDAEFRFRIEYDLTDLVFRKLFRQNTP